MRWRPATTRSSSRYGRLAGRAAARAGAHRQAASCYALVLARGDLLTPAQRGRLGEAYAWALANSNQLQAAADAAAAAVEQWRQAGDGPSWCAPSSRCPASSG